MVNEPELIIASHIGRHNADPEKSFARLQQANSYRELSTVCIIPNSGLIAAKVAERWLQQISQMNQKFVRLMMIGLEKNYGYNTSIENILATPGLANFKYVLTMEENVLPPVDGLPKLFESMEKYDVVGGLCWTPGIEGKPMIYGYPGSSSFIPVAPHPETVQECLGLGTGFTLFKLAIFRDPRVAKPWFRSSPKREGLKPVADLPDFTFFDTLHKLGYKTACDTRVKIGTYDLVTDMVW